MIMVLVVIIIILLGILLLLVRDLRRANRELRYINTHKTNALITTSTNLYFLAQFIRESNNTLRYSRKIEQMEIQKDQQLQQLLTNITHDIKTPLTVSMGYVQLLDKIVPAEFKSKLKKVQRNLELVNYYLKHLMDFNMLQEKSVTLNLSEISIKKEIEQQLFKYYDEFERKELNLDLNLNYDDRVHTDKDILNRILQNLIGNILKYGYKKVQIYSTKQNDKYVAIIFENEIEKPIKHPEQLLNRFYTDDVARTGQDFGVGLSIVQSLVVMLGGKFDVEVKEMRFKATVLLKR